MSFLPRRICLYGEGHKGDGLLTEIHRPISNHLPQGVTVRQEEHRGVIGDHCARDRRHYEHGWRQLGYAVIS